MQTNSYVELQTGMAYPANGPYVEGQEIIEGIPGGAVAQEAQIPIVLPNDLSAEPVDAQTAAARLPTAAVCSSYADYGLQTHLVSQAFAAERLRA